VVSQWARPGAVPREAGPMVGPQAGVRVPLAGPGVVRAGRGVVPRGGEPLNVPVVTEGDQLTLLVEVGRLFGADDVVVKVRNSALTLTVAADRTTDHPGAGGDLHPGGGVGGRLRASVTWEFDLPAAVDVDTLRAGLTVDGLLRVSARLRAPPHAVNSTPD